jgi:hypothetical protein
MAHFFNLNVPIVASRTGMQLLLADADYSVPWLVHQQQLHSAVHMQYQQQHGRQQQQQQHGHQQQEAAEAPAGRSVNHQQQQQHSQQQQQQEAAEAPAGSSTHHHQQQEAACGTAIATAAGTQLQPNASSSSSSSMGRHHQQQQQQRISLPPGVDPSQPVPLLLLMAHPAGPFHKALAGFRTRICCANIKHDTTVPYCTAAICTANPYEKRPPVSVDSELYPSVVQPAGEAQQDAVFPDAQGRSRLLMFLLFLPFFPAFYSYSVAKGLLHHREARKRPLDAAWLQQYRAAAEVLGAGLNPFSRQASRQLLECQQQQQQKQEVQAAGEASSSAAAAAVTDETAVGTATEASPFAAPAAAVETGAITSSSSSSRPGASGCRGLQQLLSSGGRQQQSQALHTQADSNAATAAAAAPDVVCEDEEALEELYPAAAAATAADQTEEEVLKGAGGSNALLLSRQVSRRLTAAGERIKPIHFLFLTICLTDTCCCQQAAYRCR